MASKLKGDAPFYYAYEHYLDTVYRVAIHNAPTPTDAEDVTQEVFERLIASGKSFADAEHLKAWLIRVAINLCKNLHRAKRSGEVALDDTLAVPPPPDTTVLDEVRALPERYRNTIYLHYYEGYTAAEIGQILGAGRNTVLTWLARGRQALRERMIGGFDDDEI